MAHVVLESTVPAAEVNGNSETHHRDKLAFGKSQVHRALAHGRDND
jgi:hypothetical protein